METGCKGNAAMHEMMEHVTNAVEVDVIAVLY